LIYKKCFLIAGLLYCTLQIAAQSGNINGQYNKTPLHEFLKSVQGQTDHKLYYNIKQLDTISVTLTAVNQPLSSVLQLAFTGTTIVFSIDRNKNVYITNEQQVKVNLPENYLSQPGRLIVKSSSTVDDLPEAENKRSAALDNKLYIIGDKNAPAAQSYTLAGYVRDIKTGEPVIGASVFIEQSGKGVSTDQYGYYTLLLPRGRYILNVQGIGLRDSRRQIQLFSDGKMNIDMQGQVLSLKNVVISAAKVNNIKGTQMGVAKLDMKTIRQLPVVMGEVDLLRAVLTLPGVKSTGEASTGLNVRGGSTDQNLILFNESTIYNPSHFFGMFSAFNPEMVKDIELFKSSIPVKYGGRLSSVLDIKSREGNKKIFTGSAGIGLLTSRINVEGPIITDRTSFIAGFRTTYTNWLMKYLPDEYSRSKAGFYDANLGITHEVNKKTTLFLTGYLSNDKFNLNDDTAYGYSNRNASIKLKHIFNNKLTSILSAGYDKYAYNNSSDNNPVNAYKMNFSIQQGFLRSHNTYYLNNAHTLDFGLNILYYKLNPGKIEAGSSQSIITPLEIQSEQALESAIFLGDKFTVTDNLTIEGGARFVMFNNFGPQSVRQYVPGLPRTIDNLQETIAYEKGKITKTYAYPELRLSARYTLSDDLSIKAGFNSQRQFIHMLSNTAAIAPTDIWKLSDANIKPQLGNQYSLGVYKNFKSNTIETSVEVYYKNIRNFLDYKSGAVLILNPNVETEVINTRGKAYGIELLLKKQTGKWNGWISYTYSRTLLKIDDPIAGENINDGKYYASLYDKPHEVTMINNYRLSHRYSFTINGTYSTGRPITVPVGIFYYAGSYRTLYGDRNGYRIPDYFRMDFAMNLDGNHKLKQKVHLSWTFGVYNLTGRKNPYSVYYVSENGTVSGYKLSVFGSAIPYVNFNFRF
jgi:hypothetical protein